MCWRRPERALDAAIPFAWAVVVVGGEQLAVWPHERARIAEVAIETVRVEPRPVVVVDGILLFAEPGIRELLDLRIFVDTDADVRLMRRLRRDTAERGRSIDSVLRQYEEQVRPMHLEFVEPSKRWADVIVPEGGMNRVALGMVVAQVEKLLRRS